MTPNSHFSALRIKAREQRDKAIAHIRDEYEESLRQVSELEQRLLGKVDPQRVKMSAAIESVIPNDEPFSVTTIMAALETLDPSRVWPLATVRRHITELRSLGLVLRVKKHTVYEPAVYARVGAPVKFDGEAVSLRELVLGIVTKPMRIAEVCVAVKEAGHKTRMSLPHLRTAIIRQLRQLGFKERGGKWSRG